MKTRLSIAFLLVMITALAFGQRLEIEVSFSAVDSTKWIQLDSIKVMNHTRGGDTVMYWPDTMLSLDYQPGGLPEGKLDIGNLNVFQNFPNPVKDQTTVSLYVPAKDEVGIIITDALGRVIIKEDRVLKKGYHSFRFKPGDGSLFFFTAKWRGNSRSIKILHHAFPVNQGCSLNYLGREDISPQFKAREAIQIFPFSPGDELFYIGYAGPRQSNMLDTPENSKTCTFQYATNIPCPGTPEVFYEGQVYHTVQIYSQCWFKENLNVGLRIDGIRYQTNNDTIEKYCYNDDTSNCSIYGGLYQWDEMMKYTTLPGAQGICPEGWHIPTDEEWKILEGSVDSQYGFPDPEWDQVADYRGFDVGERLKSQNSWSGIGNGSDLVGFSALATGARRYYDGAFLSIGIYTSFWTSVQTNQGNSWYRYMYYTEDGVSRYSRIQSMGRSVRCIMDD